MDGDAASGQLLHRHNGTLETTTQLNSGSGGGGGGGEDERTNDFIILTRVMEQVKKKKKNLYIQPSGKESKTKYKLKINTSY